MKIKLLAYSINNFISGFFTVATHWFADYLLQSVLWENIPKWMAYMWEGFAALHSWVWRPWLRNFYKYVQNSNIKKRERKKGDIASDKCLRCLKVTLYNNNWSVDVSLLSVETQLLFIFEIVILRIVPLDQPTVSQGVYQSQPFLISLCYYSLSWGYQTATSTFTF